MRFIITAAAFVFIYVVAVHVAAVFTMVAALLQHAGT